jgi:uncharacterized protein YjbJ (UPF0337 family)
MANQDVLKGNWKSITGAVKEKWGHITNDDLSRVEGNYDQFVGLLQRKAGQTRDQIENFLSEWGEKSGATINRMSSQAGHMMENANEYMHETYEQVSDTIGRGYENAREVVARRPMESVAVVAGLAVLGGLLVGLSLGGNRR